MLCAFKEEFQLSHSPAGSVLLWRMPSARFLGWTAGQFKGFNCGGSPICLTSAHAFKDFSLSALLTLLPLLAQGPLHQFALHSVYCLSSSNIWFFPPKAETAPEHAFVGGKDFGVCASLLSTQFKNTLLTWWILLHFCPTVGLLHGLSLIGLHDAQAPFIITGHGN